MHTDDPNIVFSFLRDAEAHRRWMNEELARLSPEQKSDRWALEAAKRELETILLSLAS